MKTGHTLPDVTFRTRVRDESVGGPNPFRWQDMTTDDYFKGKRVILFSLPGAFPPDLLDIPAPRFPDGSGEFTRKMGMLVDKDNLGFGMRSWR